MNAVVLGALSAEDGERMTKLMLMVVMFDRVVLAVDAFGTSTVKAGL